MVDENQNLGAGGTAEGSVGSGDGIGFGTVGSAGTTGAAGLPGVTDWRGSLPAELQGAPQLKDVKDIGSLAKQFIDQQRFLGNSIRIPGEDAGEPGRREFREKLMKADPTLTIRPDATNAEMMAEFWEMAGVPRDESGYEIGEDAGESEESAKEIRARAKKYGMTKSGFDLMVRDRLVLKQAGEQRAQETMAADAKSLATEWGASTEARTADVKKFAEAMGLPQEFQKALAAGRVGSEWIKALDGIVKQFGGLSEGKQIAFQAGGSIPASPTEIRSKINEIMANPIYQNNRHPEFKNLVNKVIELRKQLNAA